MKNQIVLNNLNSAIRSHPVYNKKKIAVALEIYPCEVTWLLQGKKTIDDLTGWQRKTLQQIFHKSQGWLFRKDVKND